MSSEEEAKCNLCGSQERTLHFRERFQDESVRAVKCGSCGLVYIHPRPPDISPEFEEADPGQEDYLARSRRGPYYLRWLDRLGLIQPEGRLLDIGCGTGVFLEVARKQRVFESEGLEPTGQLVALCLRKGLSVTRGSIEAADYSDELFDIVTMWDVLEHLPDPLGALRKVRRMLKPGGILLIKVPNIRSLNLTAARILTKLRGREMIIRQHPLRHLFFFSRRTLGRMASAAGLEVIETTTEASAFSAFSSSRIRRLAKMMLQVIFRIFPVGLNDEIVLIARKIT